MQVFNINSQIEQNSLFQTSFGHKNPKVGLYRAQNIKKEYARYAVDYLLPNEVWTNKKIFKTIEKLGKNIDTLIFSKKLNKETLQKTINNLLPEKAKDKVVIKDFYDLEEDFISKGFNKEQIDYWKNCNALNLTDYCYSNKKQIVYLNFNKDFQDIKNQTIFKVDIKHEFKHVLSTILQNIDNHNLFLSQTKKTIPLKKISNLFNLFEDCYSPTMNIKPVDLTKEKMLNHYGFKSTEDLFQSFDKN